MASTYVNDLRLNEMATGDQSGSWGTVTNTNLELIAEAFSYGTEAITTNADTHTTTIADGATDPGRSMFLKYTGTLDSACTITIGPNTVSKLWFIENATSGSQNIIIKQGSGATVTIASGKTKVIYSDGVGSGAKMVDAFDSLSVGALSGTSATFDGGVDIDNINIDGTTIALSSGNLTLDVAGELILDADTSGVVRLKDGGTEYGTLFTTSSNFLIKSQGNDKDIIFQGNDSGGSGFTALTLDMSDAGTASFNHDAKFADNGKAIFGAGSDLQIYHDGSFSYIKDTGVGDLRIQGSTNVQIWNDALDKQAANFNAGGGQTLYHNNSAKLATTSTGIQVTGNIANASGDLTLDASGDIILDADGADIKFRDGGAGFLTLSNNSLNAVFTVGQQDEDFIVRGYDGASLITALTLDMSDGGTAIFNHDIKLPDSGQALFGASSDLQIYHDGTHSYINDSGTGYLILKGNVVEIKGSNNDMCASFSENGATQLYYDNATKLATSSSGVTVTGTVAATSYTGNGSNLTGVGGSTTAGDVGTYTTGRPANYTTYTTGTTVAGSSLVVASGSAWYYSGGWQGVTSGGSNAAYSVGTTRSGTWRLMSYAGGGSTFGVTGLWVRIS